MEKSIQDGVERLTNLFFQRRKDRRGLNTDHEVGDAVALWLQSWMEADIAEAIKVSDWADHISGVGRAVRSMPTQAARSAQKQGSYKSPYSEPTEADIARTKAGIQRVKAMLNANPGPRTCRPAVPKQEKLPYVPPNPKDIARTKAEIARIRAVLNLQCGRDPGDESCRIQVCDLGRTIEQEGGFTDDEKPGVEPAQ